MLTLYNVISADWFVEDKEGKEDFIPDELWPETLRILGSFDVLVMGRKTYEAIQNYPPELLDPFENLGIRKVVVSRNPYYPLVSDYELVSTPEQAIAASLNTLVSSGEGLNNFLFSKSLVDEVILHQLSVELGEGKCVFDLEYRKKLHLQSETDLGLVRELRFAVSG
jgi:dihydrofolate reductase